MLEALPVVSSNLIRGKSETNRFSKRLWIHLHDSGERWLYFFFNFFNCRHCHSSFLVIISHSRRQKESAVVSRVCHFTCQGSSLNLALNDVRSVLKILTRCKGGMAMTVQIYTIWGGIWCAVLLRVTTTAPTNLLSAEHRCKLKAAGALDHSTARNKYQVREHCPEQAWKLPSRGLLALTI